MTSLGGSFSYAVFSFVVDPLRGTSIPIGIALWSPQREWVKIRLVGEDEKLPDLSRLGHFPFVQFMDEKINHWIGSRSLPHSDVRLLPWEDRWWEHVRDLLIHRVKLSEARPVDCRDPDRELEILYNSAVAPVKTSSEINRKIDGHIKDALGEQLSRRFDHRAKLPGYQNRQVQVMRSYQGVRGLVVVEGVNLSTEDAESNSDEVASRLQRLLDGIHTDCGLIVGYLPPAQGLNGEKVFVDWIENVTKARTFDLRNQALALRHEAERLVAKMDNELTFE